MAHSPRARQQVEDWKRQRTCRAQVAMGQKPKWYPPSEHPIQSPLKKSSKVGGEFSYQPKVGCQNGFDNHGQVVDFLRGGLLQGHGPVQSAWFLAAVFGLGPLKRQYVAPFLQSAPIANWV